MRIVVIGSGFGGLSAAIRLQAKGHQVIILEKRDKPGGRAYVYEINGFKFDAGPTIITAPWLIDELFQLAQKKTEDYVRLVKLDPFYNIRFEDGTIFHYNDDKENLIEQIRKFNSKDVEGYKKFASSLDEIYRVGFELIDKPFSTWFDMLRVVPKMIKLRSDRSVYRFASQFFKDESLRICFSFHPLLIGGNPFTATSIYAMIHQLEQEFGVWFAMGGTGALVNGLCRLFEEIGGKIRLNCEVKEISVNKKGEADGVILKDGEFVKADAVISNADVAWTYLNLIRPEFRKKYTDRRVKSMSYSMSLFVYYFGTDRKYPEFAHHEILMGPRYKGLLDDIFKYKKLAEDFSLYLHRPTATDESLAPKGCDCWYVLSPVPNLESGTDWKKTAPVYRDKIVKYLQERYLPDLSKHIVVDHYIDPLHFRDVLNSYLGSAFSVEPVLWQSAYFRPHNKSEDIRNLYFVGAGTHPGAGLPGVISSGKIVARMIDGA
ncbi:MAG: phytoene desaturase [Pyrinomonadaceae bacterium]|nr:phytoene desaturase [Pyrinomonadaceae bacterium]MCX7639973.1 phytoene desaturase [Pyrinomonadaceae bacterium]MDW8304145.1 phytoene desaturase [Acidobacteriota bacterium]